MGYPIMKHLTCRTYRPDSNGNLVLHSVRSHDEIMNAVIEPARKALMDDVNTGRATLGMEYRVIKCEDCKTEIEAYTTLKQRCAPCSKKRYVEKQRERKGQKALGKVNCAVCKEEFQQRSIQSLNCSEECRKVYNRLKQRKRYGKKPHTKPCHWCKKPFSTTFKRVINCSDKCSKAYKDHKQRTIYGPASRARRRLVKKPSNNS